MTFTFIQIANWRRYEKVRRGGRWNMFSKQASAATGLSEEDYLFCMNHYSELKYAAEKESA
jgi:hypothetical protein